MTTRKQSATKPANTKGKSKVEVVETPRDNRYVRASKVVAGNLTIGVDALSQQAEMSTSTARHCLECWNGVVAVLLQHGAISQTWKSRLSPKSDTKVEAAPVVTAK